MSRKLIINADDYGISPEVNDAIESLVDGGRLTDVSVLANGWSYERAVSFLREHPVCSVGVHLNAVEGVPLSPSDIVKPLMGGNGQFVGMRQLFVRWLQSPLAVGRAVEFEWRAQIELLLKDGLIITHADSHQHIHAFPPFWRALTKLCTEYKIPAVRYPRERNSSVERRTSAFALGGIARLSTLLTRRGSVVTNDHFIGFKRAGSYGEAEMINEVEGLKAGVTEMIVHPSLYPGIPYTHMNGEAEYHALQSTAIREHIESQGVERISWRSLVAK